MFSSIIATIFIIVLFLLVFLNFRSEERRVGKECGS